MRKIILNVAVSLDGLIEGPNGEFDWCFTDQDYGMKDFLDRIDIVFYGRKSYEVMMNWSDGVNPFSSKQSFVFSNSLSPGTDYTVLEGDLVENVNAIKESKGKDIWLFGGANLAAKMLNENLVDELLLAVHPIILGSGKALFSPLDARKVLKLIETKTYSSGLVSHHYGIIK